MALDQFLIIFACLFIVVMMLLVLVPYLLGRSDLPTSWNLFLIGSANFIGASSIGAATSEAHYIEYDDGDYYRFFLGVVTFYTTLVLTYYWVKIPRRVAGLALLKWPPVTVPVLFLMVPIAPIFIMGARLLPPIPFLSPLLFQVGVKAVVFTLVLAFVAWYKQKYNPILLATWPAVLGAGLILGITFGTGRRPIVAILLAIPICLYWLRWRYRRPVMNVLLASAVLAIFAIVMGAYTQVRHRGRGAGVERTFDYAVESLQIASEKIFTPRTVALLGQNAGECSLLAIHMYTHDLPPQPFHSLFYVLVNPIPRMLWHDKPTALGSTLPKDGRTLYRIGFTRSTWGPGIVGHGYHEGGPVMLVFYGILFGMVLRLFDELLMRQPDNPYLLGCFTAISSHIIGWPRGDIGTFALQIIFGVLMVLIIRSIGRLVFGTGLVYPRTSYYDITKQGFVPR
ncbi:MAG: hypothetical protein ACC628_07855 [Pirellulaceae bacterium]